MKNKLRGMCWKRKTSRILFITLLFTVFLYQGWWSPTSAFAGTQTLGTATATNTNITTTGEQLRLTIPSTANQGGLDATDATIVLSGTGLSAANVASVSVYYGGILVATVTNPANISNIPVTLAGNQKGGSDWTFYVSFNPGTSVTNFRYSVTSMTGTTGAFPYATAGCSVSIPNTTTLGTGADPSANTIAPGATATDVNLFTFQTDSGTEAISSVTLNLSTASGIGRLSVTNTANTELGFTTAPATGTNTINVTGMSATTTATTFKVRLTPLSHAAMPAVPGGAYSVTAPVTGWGGMNTHAGSDTNANALTIDNASPASATNTSGSAGTGSANLTWTTSSSPDFATGGGSVVLRWQSASAGAEKPVEGSSYSAGNSIGAATVACVTSSAASNAQNVVDGAGGSAGCTTTALTAVPHTYKVFQRDANGNYDAGVPIATVTPTTADSTPPTIGAVNVTPTSGIYTSSAPTITATAIDGESAVTGCAYTTNGTDWLAASFAGGTCTATPSGLSGALTINIRATSTGGTAAGTPVNRTVDATGPTDGGPLVVTPGDQQNALSWSAASDPIGILQYDVRFVTGTTPPASCAAGTSVYTGSNTSYLHGSLTNDQDYAYRVCAYDTFGNPSTGLTGAGRPTAVTTPPNTVSATSAAVAAAATDSAKNVVMQRLTVNCDTVSGAPNKLVLSSLTLDDAGTATAIAAVKIYLSGTSSDTLPATALLVGGKSRWDGTSVVLPLTGGADTARTVSAGTPKYLYIVYDMAYGQSGKSVRSHVTAVGAAAPAISASALNLSANTLTLNAGSSLAVISDCSGCHGYPPADGTARNNTARAVVGSHTPHAGKTCADCHIVPATTTSADFDHRNGLIELVLDFFSYTKGASFAQTNDLDGSGLGTCGASCHNVYGATTTGSLQWGVAGSGCADCHSVAIGATGPATGSHTLGGHNTACTACHATGTAQGSAPATGHADGDIDIVNVGYPADVAKHAAGSGYSTCSAASCHANVYGTGTITTPAWGATGSGCAACHSVALAASGPATGSHATHNEADCSKCHAGASNNTTVPSANHADGDIDVTNGYPLTAKHAAGSYAGTCSTASCHANVYGTGTVATPVWGTAAGCDACHTVVIGATGPATGSHALAGHNTACTACHATSTAQGTVPATGHADGDIDIVNVGYPANVTKHAAGSGYATCSSASCHANVYGTGTIVSPTWGSTGNGCAACHSARPITATGPATGAHAKHMGLAGAACTKCHNSGTTATTSPSSEHADGNVDVTGGYPLNYAKHAFGSGYSTCNASYCHSSGQSTTGGATPVYATSPNWGMTGTTCASCHRNMDTDAAATGNHVIHAQTNAIICASCHNGYTETTVAAATHVNSSIDLSFSGTLATGTIYSQGNSHPAGNGFGTCNSSYCHSSGQSTTGGATPVYATPTWGSTGSNCGSCHLNMDSNASATGDHVKHAQTYPFTCATCHSGYTETTVASATHINKTIELSFSGNAAGTVYSQGTAPNNGVGNNYGSCTTSYCHSTGQSATGGTTPTYPGTAPVWGTTTMTCGSCHLDFDSNAAATGDHVKHAQGTANISCATCHSGYTETAVAASTHSNKSIELSFSGTGAGTAYSGGTTAGNHAVGGGFGNCTASKCHGQGAPVWGGALYSATVLCENCHGSAATNPFYSTAASGAAPTKTIAETDSKVGAHVAHLTARSGYTNAVVCGDCHVVPAVWNAAGHMDGSTTPTFGATAKLNAANPSYAASTCSNTYCHGAKMLNGSTNGTDTSPAWTQTAYLTGTPSKTGDCAACHGCPPTGYTGSSHAGSETLADCNGCHTHVNTNGTFTAGANRALHMNGIVEASGGDCLGCHGGVKSDGANADIGNDGVRAITAEFSRTSHHVTGVTVNKYHCSLCHMEGGTDGSTSGTLHKNGQIDLRNVDTNTAIVWTGSEHANMDNFCFACHDNNGVSNATVRGIVSGSTATNPFNGTLTNSYDQVARAGVLDVKTQFTTTNYSHHAVSGQKYTTQTPLFTDGRFVSTFTPLGGAQSIRDTSTVHCGDCHTNGKWATSGGIGAHGSTNEYMLQTATGTDQTHTSTNYVCFKCHVGSIYDNLGGKTLGGTAAHIVGANASDYVHTAGSTGITGRATGNGHITGMTCSGCHNSGQIGWGGIHGGNATYSDGNNAQQQTRRFMPGMANSKYIPDGWTSGTSTGCYTLNDSNWSSCNQHPRGGKGVTRLARPTSY